VRFFLKMVKGRLGPNALAATDALTAAYQRSVFRVGFAPPEADSRGLLDFFNHHETVAVGGEGAEQRRLTGCGRSPR